MRGFIIAIAVLLSLQSINLNLVDVVKIPLFIEHYNDHRIEHGDSFLTFLDKHYGSEKSKHQSEHSEHKELPFHSGLHFLVGVEIQRSFSIEWINSVDIKSKDFFNYTEKHFPSFEVDINQPPRISC
jgi:hypothetical protein